MYYEYKEIFCQYPQIKNRYSKILSHAIASENVTPEGNSKKRTKPESHLIYLCIVMRCIMNIKKFFVNTPLILAYS